MNIQHFKYIQKVAETKSVTIAAQELFLTQPTLSSAIKSLEDELRITIFERQKKGVQLTNEGKEFLNHINRILGEIDLIESRYQKRVKKSFQVASHHYDFLATLLSKLYYQFKDDYEEFRITETTTRHIIESVANLESDVGLFFLSKTNDKIIKSLLKKYSLDVISLGDFSTHVFLGKNHPLSQKKTISREQLDDYPEVRFHPDPKSELFDENPSINANNPVFYCTDRGTTVQLLLETDAYSLGLNLLEKSMKNQVHMLPLEDGDQYSLVMVMKQNKMKDGILAEFINLLEGYLQD